MPGPITLTITYDGKSTNVHGPIDNQLLCYGLLAMAHDVVAEYHTEKLKAGEPQVKIAPGLPSGLIRP